MLRDVSTWGALSSQLEVQRSEIEFGGFGRLLATAPAEQPTNPTFHLTPARGSCLLLIRPACTSSSSFAAPPSGTTS